MAIRELSREAFETLVEGLPWHRFGGGVFRTV